MSTIREVVCDNWFTVVAYKQTDGKQAGSRRGAGGGCLEARGKIINPEMRFRGGCTLEGGEGKFRNGMVPG